MARRSTSGNSLARQDPGVIDAHWETIQTHPMGHGGTNIVVGSPRSSPMSAIGDGGHYDARQGPNPVYVIMPRADRWSIFMIYRAFLSAFRHHPVATPLGGLACIWLTLFGVSFTLNMLRGDTVTATGSLWQPTVVGTNLAHALTGPVQGLAGSGHNVMLGTESLGEPLAPVQRNRVVKVSD